VVARPFNAKAETANAVPLTAEASSCRRVAMRAMVSALKTPLIYSWTNSRFDGPLALKVVQVLPALDGGGVEQGTLEIARALVAAGHESVVVSSGGRLVDTLSDAGSRHVAWDIGRKRPSIAFDVLRFRRWLDRERPDVVHARSRIPAWVAWLAWRRMAPAARPRFVTTVHGLYRVGRYSAVMTRGERVIAVSETAHRYALDNYPGLDANRVIRIYRGIDATRFNKGFRPSPDWLRRWRAAYPALGDRPMVVLPGRITRLKGHAEFIAAMAHLRTNGVDAVGVIVGGVEPRHRAYREALAKQAPELVFTGHRSDVREIMAHAAAVVSLSTRPESFGRTVLEALSLGTPVVGYDHGGVGEILAAVYPEGRVPVGDHVAAADRLTRILADRHAACQAVRDHDFEVERMCAETLAVYAQLGRAAT